MPPLPVGHVGVNGHCHVRVAALPADVEGLAKLRSPGTQKVAQYLWTRKNPDGTDLCDAPRFRSRHGDDLLRWAVFEPDTDTQNSYRITDITELPGQTPEPETAFAMLGPIRRATAP